MIKQRINYLENSGRSFAKDPCDLRRRIPTRDGTRVRVHCIFYDRVRVNPDETFLGSIGNFTGLVSEMLFLS